MASSVGSSSAATDAVDGGSSSSADTTALQKKLSKVEKCIVEEESLLASIQDQFIQLGISQLESPKQQSSLRELEQANAKAARHIEEYKKKKKKYETAIKMLEEQQRTESAVRTKKELKDPKSGGGMPPVEPVKTGARMMNSLLRKNGENGSARSRDSRGSKDETSPAQFSDNHQHLKVLPSEVSLSSMESDSQESAKRHRRLDEIADVVTGKLEPLVGDIHGVQDRMDELFKLVEDNKAEWSEERKASTAVFDDIIRRCAYVEEQIHDLIELHQKETAEAKTYLVDTQDKMNYVFNERIRDMKDEITGLNTRIAKIEHRQKEDESLARTEAAKSVLGEMAFKMVDVLLLFGQLVIAVVGAISHFFQMTAENSTRLVVFLVCIIAFLVVFQFREDLPFNKEVTATVDSVINRLEAALPDWIRRRLVDQETTHENITMFQEE
ncbi:hypothetical protein RvY_01482 [Ramazzottius varieornatus]|uniref:Uncharacterized protein n=1 Tax=Ramazzottius varieornatus TaxID=947166 RepID=A0A1D1UR67_RAMVA|nr:hypothetical protein RvY_01482 [Ramazzottius varieornatus]